ncbi:solute carrier family 25 [Salpingoeca rosetta]|uniref:Solute carrier family 25 n=1 Tax=Salpingoeca rosetta (strain ATCC 50818 / BSB-021) TaxID=946362 RepID=F2UF51_SALR5|nr:solute carrier family 25 [Salpingoeca rosetta]EGD75251.1 solute carrier family 25 [Salpingoeca rosetta]|eukprot:XP_004992304.1 solute carrier family 25 [Salpingoeca rosetta]
MRGAEAPSDQVRASPVRNFVAGGLTGCVAKTVVMPLDRLKILLQGHHPKYHRFGVLSGLRAIYRNEGVRGYFRGNKAQMMRVFPYAAVQFLVYEKSREFYIAELGQKRIVSLFAGSTAGICAVCTTYPLDVLRSRMAFKVGDDLTVRQAVRDILHTEGSAAFFRGLKPTLAGMIPYAGVSFFCYENFKAAILSIPALRQRRDDPRHLNPLANIAVGGVAGAVAQTVSYPLDVVRRRMQLDAHRPDQAPRYRSIAQALKAIYAENGMRSLFRGLTINYIREIPQAGVAYTAYELLKRLLKVYQPVVTATDAPPKPSKQ